MALKSEEHAAIHYRKRLEGVKPTKELLELLELSLQQAQPTNHALQEWKENRTDRWIPISILRAMQQVLEPHDCERLEKALQQTSLVFTPKPPPAALTKEQEEYRKRIERLSLKHEERRYTELTSNVNKAPEKDDVTTRSMTYAASVGLNMVIAPLSFGCFMYFFAGGLFDFFLESDDSSSKSDMKRVVIGVVSGVIMLFIEMLLFVIRTHEMDEAMRKKSKRATSTQVPFSQYTSETKKTFVEEKKSR
jgi:hypothetical protein